MIAWLKSRKRRKRALPLLLGLEKSACSHPNCRPCKAIRKALEELDV